MPKGIIKADVLRRQMRGDEEAEDFVNGILELIEDNIHQAMDRNENVAYTEVSVYFPIPHTKPEDAQRTVYYHTIKALESAGYKARIIFDNADMLKPKTTIIVTWANSREIAEKKYMDEYIKAHTVMQTAPPRRKRK